MDRKARWMLPDGVDELLPPEAAQAEALRRRLLDLFDSWGYELIMPPFIEYLEALLTGTGRDLDVQTFKVTDQLSGRTLGVRPDITPQAARIDAHQLRREGITRLCYIGSTLQARAEGPAGSRNAVQLGAELYGHAGVESDLEVISLMLATLRAAGVEQLHLDVGHVGIFEALLEDLGLGPAAEEALLDALQRKAGDEIAVVLAEAGVETAQAERLSALVGLHGGVEVLERAQTVLGWAGPAVAEALEQLRVVADSLARREPELPLHLDLGELRGYRYHTGLVFAAYTPGYGQELARGGRYDGIGRAFGRPRPATGYSADLKALLNLGGGVAGPAGGGVLAPWGDDPALHARVAELRAAGERVVWQLPGDEQDNHGCDRRLVERNGTWELDTE
ncbi:MAG: ATP phosphoribosyltransferase regulatory subunit [Halorhodospira halophila]|uniref:ATP phosphoribosyltransferase regulatory subunit n=1 Tax=Halorhodospira TaxID=85108 RepID=UPI001914D131|nr:MULTISPECIES: ATP phosphoribosyltransferase regulatory subunit [Halorhodospira]MBK5942974.1 ATP phosphoribosyltransferase regulatory subunit [Halorhodospira halophila]MCC3751143.1 ATP phosphoribosyltransferase regulatory subunit [Halorhodospira halophila]MCG5528572.1 ATP phosphoribosyltransferase regulatory subunit [Halorhodospira halophila]MCG5533574.1 ATP phosphoribosyltransferase regulatory subunit [Halorhodospira sp. 9621]MCG5537406.1 ATP phosphoribosyltransferase regulatory subunit [Ha